VEKLFFLFVSNAKKKRREKEKRGGEEERSNFQSISKAHVHVNTILVLPILSVSILLIEKLTNFSLLFMETQWIDGGLH